VLEEMAGRPFPHSGEPVEVVPVSTSKNIKGKKTKSSTTTNEATGERRRQSLLSMIPWSKSKNGLHKTISHKITIFIYYIFHCNIQNDFLVYFVLMIFLKILPHFLYL